MSYSGSTISYSDPQPQETATSATTTPTPLKESAELKLYQAFIFSVPIFFTFVLLFVFYLFYLRRRGVDWDSLRMRNSSSLPASASESDDSSRAEMGLKKEVREMLPIILFMENLSHPYTVEELIIRTCLSQSQGYTTYARIREELPGREKSRGLFRFLESKKCPQVPAK